MSSNTIIQRRRAGSGGESSLRPAIAHHHHHHQFVDDRGTACVVVSVGPDGSSGVVSDFSSPSAALSSSSALHHGDDGERVAPASTPAQVQQLLQKEGGILSVVYRRLSVLVSLLLLQSMSQFVLESFEDVVQANIVIPLFLTMLVGAGGNAGNQSAVRAIAMLAKGEINGSRLTHIMPVIKRECVIGFVCAMVLSIIGALRVFAHQLMRRAGDDASPGAPASTSAAGAGAGAGAGGVDVKAGIAVTVFAISLSLFLIVFLSALIGVVLPFLFLRFGSSAEHAAPAIQVIMDVLGVFLTCIVCWTLLPSAPAPASASGGMVGKPLT
jgi:hypothetical protein